MAITFLAFIIFAISQIGTPGPANMALLTTGARFGLRAALPFVAGVALGKQLIIWPLGFGLLGVMAQFPLVFEALKYASAAYILYLAWRVAFMRLQQGQVKTVPGFAAGLIVHPLNPKAWAMVTAGFTGFVTPGAGVFTATLSIAAVLLAVQIVLHPLWAGLGEVIASRLSGSRWERPFFILLAILTLLSVLYALFGGAS